jgi:hypothetical protein
MNLSTLLARHLREVHFGGNWTSVNLKEQLAGVSWQQATTQVDSLNTIAALVYHVNYYVDAVLKLLQQQPLKASDKYSFSHQPITSAEDWQGMLDKTWADAENFAVLVEQMPEHKLWEDLWENKYGDFYRNIQGIIEHTHYHLGQIVLIKKLLVQQGERNNQPAV